MLYNNMEIYFTVLWKLNVFYMFNDILIIVIVFIGASFHWFEIETNEPFLNPVGNLSEGQNIHRRS